MGKKLTIAEFVKKAREVHGDKYDYSKVEYINSRTNICIICPEHGAFLQTPANHLRGHRCPKCSGKVKLTTSEFVKKAREVHGGKYDYSKVKYVNSYTDVCIICPEHGEFLQAPNEHLQGNGCPKCAGNAKLNTTEFIKKAREAHGDKYDYSKVKYVDTKTKVCIICPEHGEFWQTPHMHLRGQGCPKCGIENLSLTKEEFINKACEAHGDKYDYSKVEYVNSYTKVCIICQEHGEFWQTPYTHLSGCGCPNCNSSKLESEIRLMLDEQSIKYNYRERKIPWLNGLELDFYILDKNIAIECQGMQHFKPIEFFGGEEQFKSTIENDNTKRKLCKENGIRLLYYSNLGIEYPYKVFENKEELLKEILSKPPTS